MLLLYHTAAVVFREAPQLFLFFWERRLIGNIGNHRFLQKEDCVRVLDIIDLKDCYADLLAIDSFTADFRLAWNITHELHFKEEPL